MGWRISHDPQQQLSEAEAWGLIVWQLVAFAGQCQCALASVPSLSTGKVTVCQELESNWVGSEPLARRSIQASSLQCALAGSMPVLVIKPEPRSLPWPYNFHLTFCSSGRWGLPASRTEAKPAASLSAPVKIRGRLCIYGDLFYDLSSSAYYLESINQS